MGAKLRGSAATAFVVGILTACVGDDPTPSSTGSPNASLASSVGGRSIRCNGSLCSGTDVCCVVINAGGNFESGLCKAREACATTYFDCDSAKDCPQGKVCCAKTNGGSYVWSASSCQATCASPDRQLCDDDADCTGGASCENQPSDLRPPSLKACRDH